MGKNVRHFLMYLQSRRRPERAHFYVLESGRPDQLVFLTFGDEQRYSSSTRLTRDEAEKLHKKLGEWLEKSVENKQEQEIPDFPASSFTCGGWTDVCDFDAAGFGLQCNICDLYIGPGDKGYTELVEYDKAMRKLEENE